MNCLTGNEVWGGKWQVVKYKTNIAFQSSCGPYSLCLVICPAFAPFFHVVLATSMQKPLETNKSINSLTCL